MKLKTIRSATGSKDSHVYNVAADCERAGWQVTLAEPTMRADGGAFYFYPFDPANFMFWAVQLVGSTEGVLVIDEAPPAWTPPFGFQFVEIGSGFASASVRLNGVLAAIGMLGGLPSFNVENLSSTAAILRFNSTSAPDSGLNTRKIISTISQISIGTAIGVSITPSQGGGYICRCASLRNVSNYLSLFITVGFDYASGGTFPSFRFAKDFLPIAQHPFYSLPAIVSGTTPTYGHLAKVVTYVNENQWHFVHTEAGAFNQKPVGALVATDILVGFTSGSFSYGFTETTNSFRDTLEVIGGKLAYIDNIPFTDGSFSIYIPFIRTYEVTETDKVWESDDAHLTEACVVFKANTSADYRFIGHMPNSVLAAREFPLPDGNYEWHDRVYSNFKQFGRNNLMIGHEQEIIV